jgi:hypothetical protein
MVEAAIFDEDERLEVLTLAPDSEPEPDVALLRREDSGDRTRHRQPPLPGDQRVTDSNSFAVRVDSVTRGHRKIPERLTTMLSSAAC